MSRDQYPNGSGSSNRSFFANIRLEQDHPKNKSFKTNCDDKNYRSPDKRNGYDLQGGSNLQVPLNLAAESDALDDEEYELDEEQEEEYEDNQPSINQQQNSQESDIIDISDSEEEEEQVNGSYQYNNNNINNNNYEVRSQNVYQNVISESEESNDCEIVSEYNDANAQHTRDPHMTVLDIEIEEASRISTNGTAIFFLQNIVHVVYVF